MAEHDFMKLTGKVAIVWGAGQGMGESSATQLALAGCKIAMVDFHEGRCKAATQRLKDQGFEAVALFADITKEDQVIRATNEAEAALGPLDIMVTIVGVSTWKPLLEVTEEDWVYEHNMNQKSVLYAARAAARSMLKDGRPGSIICVNSVSGLTSAPMHAPYGAAKAGLTNLVRSMAIEWGPDIRVNAVAPGTIITQRLPLLPEQLAPDSPYSTRIPMARRGTTDEIGKAVLFLASDLASYVTSQTLPVDGGWTAGWLFDVKVKKEGNRPGKLAD